MKTYPLRVAICLLAFGHSISAQRVVHLQTLQTQLEMQAQPSAPRLISLRGPQQKNFWINEMSDPLIEFAEFGGKTAPLNWKLAGNASTVTSSSVAFVYECAFPKLRLTWQWKAPVAIGPIEHRIRIENLSAEEIWIPLQDSFQFRWRIDGRQELEHYFVDKGAGKPSAVGVHRSPLHAGAHWVGTSSTYAHRVSGEAQEIIPWLAVQNASGSLDGWYAGVEFSGRVQLSLARDATSLRGTIGLNANPNTFRTRLKPNASFETPPVFIGAYAGGMDGMGNVLRPWVRQALGNRRTWQNPQYPVLVNNSWGSGMQVDESLAARMIRDSAELGLEMFGLDAGWFRGVGDWYPNAKKFPNGLAAVASEAHRRGLKFGIWVDWTQAALGTQPGALNLRDRRVTNWTVADMPPDWKPQEYKGVTIDLGLPAASAYARGEVNRMVQDYKLDMVEHDGYLVAQGCVRTDHPHAPPDPTRLVVENHDGGYIVNGANSTDVSYHAVRAYYNIQDDLRKRHPGLLLEICNDGGRMIDFGSAAHGDYFAATDTYDPLSNRRAFYDTSHLLPAAMLESYVEKWPVPNIENFRYMLRSGMMGWLTLMLDTNTWTAQQRTVAKEEISLYKAELRSFIRDADLYHISQRPDGLNWDGVEYFDPRRAKGVIYAFRGSGKEEGAHRFRLQGISANATYLLRFQGDSSQSRQMEGNKLLQSGLAVTLKEPLSSELIFIDEMR